jgi:hypothetical protein
MDHEQRVYGWLYRAAKDAINDIDWTLKEADVVAAGEKLRQIRAYLQLGIAEADRVEAERQRERAEKLKALVQRVPEGERSASQKLLDSQ